MKRKGNLFLSFASFENLWSAWQKAAKGSRHSTACSEYGFYAEHYIFNLRERILQGTYKPGFYHCFTIKDPKERIISVAPFEDRIVHHALVNILEPIYERIFDYHSYATRKGKGTHKAILQAQTYMKKYEWFLKMDIRKYFDSVDHAVLKGILERKIKDEKFLRVLFAVLDNAGAEGKGIPIGNLTSQFLANVYLDQADHYFRQTFSALPFVRYMDDIVVFGNSKDILKELKIRVEGFLDTCLKLLLKKEATQINRCVNGISFLGARIYRSVIRIHPKTLKLSTQTLNKRKWEYRHHLIDLNKYGDVLQSIVAHISWFDTRALRKKMIIEGKRYLEAPTA